MKWRIKPVLLSVCFGLVMLSAQSSRAALPEALLKIIKEAVVKIIKAADLILQQQQNQTIWLQNAQKELENILTKLKLDEIADWTEKQREQYRKYYQELIEVKKAISGYQRIKEITAKQARLVNEYKLVWGIISSDNNFSSKEIEYMYKVYSGIMEESLRNVDQITMIVKSMHLKMDDAARIDHIHRIAQQVDENYNHLKLFNQQNILLSIQRSDDRTNSLIIRNLYGLN